MGGGKGLLCSGIQINKAEEIMEVETSYMADAFVSGKNVILVCEIMTNTIFAWSFKYLLTKYLP